MMKKSVIALCFLFFIIVILLFLIFQNQAILPIDRDDSFYFSDCGYMYYNNGFLFPYNDNKYDGKEITNLKNSYIDGQNYKLYITNKELYFCNEDNKDKKLLGSAEKFYISDTGDILSQKNGNTLSIYNYFDDTVSEIKTDLKYTINNFVKKDNYIILSSRYYNTETQNTTFKVEKYKSNNYTLISSYEFASSDNSKVLFTDSEIFLIAPPRGHAVFYRINIDDKKLEKIFEYDNVKFVTSNGYGIVFSSVTYVKSQLIRQVDENNNNGVFIYNVKSNTLTKLSDDCDMEDLISTDNYIYAYHKKYVLPKGLANSWTMGYSIKDYPILND